MKIRLSTLVFLLFATPGVVGALAMAGALSVNLNQGFQDYLTSRDQEELRSLAVSLEAAGQARGGLAAFASGALTLPILARQASPMPRGAAPREGRPSQQGRSLGPPRLGGPRDRPPPPPEGASNRLAIFSVDGTQLAGPPPPRHAVRQENTLRQDVSLDGVVVGSIGFLPRGPTPEGVDARFLASQYRVAGLLVALVVLLSLIPAWLAARSGARLVSKVKAATGSIAQGRYDQRAPDSSIIEAAAVTTDINAMGAHLANLETARRRWLAEISHELRTPLSAMRGEIDALADGIRPLTSDAIVSIREETLQLGRLVDDLHFLAIADLSGPPCRFAPANVVQLCESAIARTGARAVTAGLLIELSVHGTPPPEVSWDARRIGQVLDNLLINCLRYTDSPGHAVIAISADPTTITLSVQDSPPGVSEDELTQLFEPLYRSESARERTGRGSGLGLAVCATIVRAHGGSMDASVSPLGGLQVDVRLPIEASQP